jgi:hypothetical protein
MARRLAEVMCRRMSRLVRQSAVQQQASAGGSCCHESGRWCVVCWSAAPHRPGYTMIREGL